MADEFDYTKKYNWCYHTDPDPNKGWSYDDVLIENRPAVGVPVGVADRARSGGRRRHTYAVCGKVMSIRAARAWRKRSRQSGPMCSTGPSLASKHQLAQSPPRCIDADFPT